MLLYDVHHKPIDVDAILKPEDSDRKGLEACLDAFNRVTCRSCSWNLIVFDAFVDYFLDNLAQRRVSQTLIEAYRHVHNGQKILHCLYNGCSELNQTCTKERAMSP